MYPVCDFIVLENHLSFVVSNISTIHSNFARVPVLVGTPEPENAIDTACCVATVKF
jgi:hypothetical protein